MPSSNPVHQRANEDYNPALVAVEFGALLAFERPRHVGAMHAVLQDSPMAGRPELFTAFLIAMDVLNYQFWNVSPTGEFIRYQHAGLTGALAMQEAFIDCWTRHIGDEPNDDVALHKAVNGMKQDLQSGGLQGLFGDIPEPASRLDLLNEVLDEDLLRGVAKFLVFRVRHSDQLGWCDAQMLAYLLPKCYADPYLKKAQLTLMFIAAQWRAMNVGKKVSLDVSAAADYQLPKVLRSLGALTYSAEVAQRIDSGQLIPSGDPVERAIRAATIIACDVLATHFKVGVEAVDFWLWENRNAAKDAKFHLTVTTHY